MNHRYRHRVTVEGLTVEPVFHDEQFRGCWTGGTVGAAEFRAAAREQMLEQIKLTCPPVTFTNWNGLAFHFGSEIVGQFDELLDDIIGTLGQEYWRLEANIFDDETEEERIGIWPMDTGDSEPWEAEARFVKCDPADEHATLVTFGRFDGYAFAELEDRLAQRWELARHLLSDSVPDFKWGYGAQRAAEHVVKLRETADLIEAAAKAKFGDD